MTEYITCFTFQTASWAGVRKLADIVPAFRYLNMGFQLHAKSLSASDLLKSMPATSPLLQAQSRTIGPRIHKVDSDKRTLGGGRGQG